MQYDSFYFLHVPKSDGRRFTDSIVIPLKNSNPEFTVYNQEEYIPVNENDQSPFHHQGWDSRITDSTYIVMIMRDPIERAVSWYIDRIKADVKNTPGYNKNTKVHLLKDKFINYVNTDSRFYNPVSKCLLNDLGKDRSFLTNNSPIKNIDLVFERALRVNMIIKMNTFMECDKNLISEKITKDLYLNKIIPDLDVFKETDYYTNSESKELYLSLTDSDKENIKKNLMLDYYIYNNEDLFWKP
jgi:hypothetical protein